MRRLFKGILRDSAGDIVSLGTVTVKLAGTETLANIYETITSEDILSYVLSDTDGVFSFYVSSFEYDITQRFSINLTKVGSLPVSYEVDIPDIILQEYDITGAVEVAVPLLIPYGVSYNISGSLTFTEKVIIGSYPVFTGTGSVIFNNSKNPILDIVWFGEDKTDTTIVDALSLIGTSQTTILQLSNGTWEFTDDRDWSAYTSLQLLIPAGCILDFDEYDVKLPKLFPTILISSLMLEVLSLSTINDIKTYLGLNTTNVYKGGIDCSTNPNYPEADNGNSYRCLVAGKIGGASGVDVGVGDEIICNTDDSPAGTQAEVGDNWDIYANPAAGAVFGPSTSVDNALVQFDGTDGNLIKGSLLVGTAANNIVQLNAKAKLPAVDGSLLTNVTSTPAEGAISGAHFAAITSGDTTILASAYVESDFQRASQSYGIAFKYVIKRFGVCKLIYTLGSSTYSITGYASIRVNGIEQYVKSGSLTSPYFGSHDLTVHSGDEISIYIKSSSSYYAAQLGQVYIKCTDPLVGELTTY